MEVIPSILAKTREEFEKRVKLLETRFSAAHLDITDGIFVANKTIDGFLELESLETSMTFTVHLMVSKPENHIARWLDLSAGRQEHLAESFIFHVEATQKHVEIIDAARAAEHEIGIALNPQTPHSAVSEFVDLVDFVHFMTVEPGFYGGKFIPEVVDKIADFHFYYPDKTIIVDGGITPENIDILKGAGATQFIVGTAIDKFANHLIT